MPDNQFIAKWIMKNSKLFTAEKEGYTLVVRLGGWYPVWDIIKEGVVVDASFYHTPTKCELSARIQAERCLNKILNITP